MLDALLDTNILLDVALKREPWYEAAKKILEAGQDARHMHAFISPMSLKDTYFIVTKLASEPQARAFLRYVLECCEVLPVGASACATALAEGFPEPDFEDGLIAAAAMEGHVDLIISRDEDAFNDLPVMKIHPQLFAAFFLSDTPYPKQTAEMWAALKTEG